MALPKIPKKVWSALGPIEVVDRPLIRKKGWFGYWDSFKRRICIDTSAHPETHIATLFHEMTHVALWDSGVRNALTHEQTEAVCDAMGLYLAGAHAGGTLLLRDLKDPT